VPALAEGVAGAPLVPALAEGVAGAALCGAGDVTAEATFCSLPDEPLAAPASGTVAAGATEPVLGLADAPPEGAPAVEASAAAETLLRTAEDGTVFRVPARDRLVPVDSRAANTVVLKARATDALGPHTRPVGCWAMTLLSSESIRDPAPIGPGG
jgi:hypothetical protein